MINQLFIKLFEEGTSGSDNNACIEYSENLFILITKSHEKLTQCSNYAHILENIDKIKNIDKTIYPNITSKIKFKFMDIYDFINKK